MVAQVADVRTCVFVCAAGWGWGAFAIASSFFISRPLIPREVSLPLLHLFFFAFLPCVHVSVCMSVCVCVWDWGQESM